MVKLGDACMDQLEADGWDAVGRVSCYTNLSGTSS